MRFFRKEESRDDGIRIRITSGHNRGHSPVMLRLVRDFFREGRSGGGEIRTPNGSDVTVLQTAAPHLPIGATPPDPQFIGIG
jgi:hypothetical protein